MNAAVDSAAAGFQRRFFEAVKTASGDSFFGQRSLGESGVSVRATGEMHFLAKDGRQHCGGRCAECTMSRGVGRERRRAQERSPRAVLNGGLITVQTRLANGIDGSPQVIGV